MNKLDIIIKPVVTEKSAKDAEQRKYHFIVKKNASKGDIKNAIETLFDVKVEAVNTIVYENREEKKRGYKVYKTGSNYKKAIVQLIEGQQIDLVQS